MANITTLQPSRAKQRAEAISNHIARRRRVLRLMGARSYEGVQVIENQPRSIING